MLYDRTDRGKVMSEELRAVLNVTPIKSEIIEMSGEWPTTYERSGPDSWMVQMGESWEPVYDAEDLEAAYQKHLSWVSNHSRTS